MPPPTATYDPALPQDRDWVRRLCGDTDVDNGAARLFDQEIDALLAAEQSNGKSGGESSQVYLAAARAVEIMYTTARISSGGIIETQIGGLRLKRGDESSTGVAVDTLVSNLRKRGAWLLSPSPRAFRVL